FLHFLYWVSDIICVLMLGVKMVATLVCLIVHTTGIVRYAAHVPDSISEVPEFILVFRNKESRFYYFVVWITIFLHLGGKHFNAVVPVSIQNIIEK
ncbi:hypothetical protein ACJX0J_035006, partial [Zea mays]